MLSLNGAPPGTLLSLHPVGEALADDFGPQSLEAPITQAAVSSPAESPEYPGTEDNGASQGHRVKCRLSKNERTEKERD